jgi:PAS domain S-box-containing protein
MPFTASLQKSAHLFRCLFEEASLGIAVEDLDGRLLLANPALCSMLGFQEEELCAMSCSEFANSEDSKEDWALFQKLRAGLIDRYSLEKRYVRKDGTQIWGRLNVSRLKSGDEEAPLVFAFVEEITERKRAEQELDLAHERLRLAMKSGRVVGWDLDVKSGRDSWFGDLRTQFGIPSDSFVGRVEDFYRRVHPEDRARVAKAVQEAKENQELYASEFRILWPDGTVRWVSAEGKFYYAANGEAERMLGASFDITDRKLAEEARRESAEGLRLAMQAGKMYAYVWDIKTDVIVRSEESEYVLDWPRDSPIDTGRKFVARVHPDDREQYSVMDGALTPGNPTCQVTYRLIRPNGSLVWLREGGRAFFDEEGRMLQMTGVVSDVTEHKLAEAALSQVSRRLIDAQEHERTRIARELHDDVAQRLAVLSIELKHLQQDPPSSAVEISDRVGEMRRQIIEISTDVQALSHELHSSKLEYLGIVAAMRSFCREFGEQQKIEIDFGSHDLPTPLPVEVSLCLFRVLQEALHNAAKYSGVRHFEVQLWGSLNEIHLTISDLGGGFDVQAAMLGPGLGLTSMTERLHLVKGEISIVSAPNRGTTIQARVPLVHEIKSAQAG